MMTEPIISLTGQLIRFASTNDENINRTIAFCAEWLGARGVPAQVMENEGLTMLVAEIGTSGPTIILNGHVDVVPAQPELFVPRIEDGKMYGRGSNDMLGAVAVMMQTVVELADSPLPCRVILALVPDEEKGGEIGTGFLVKQGVVGDFVICGEPTGLKISIQSKGILQLTIEVPGVSAHGSRPWLGKNAIVAAVQNYLAIEALPVLKETSALFPNPSFNLAKIAGGQVINQVPDKCTFSLDIRYLPGQNPDEIVEMIRSAAKGATVTVDYVGAPVEVEADNGFVKQLMASTELETGRSARLFGQDGSADTRFYAALGIPAVEFGPTGANHHGPDEYVEVESLEQYKRILKHFIQNIAKNEEERG